MRPLIPEGGRQPARYLISGGVCASANNGLLIAGARAGLGLLELTLLSFLAMGTAGYVAHVYFTFRQVPGWRSYARFMAGVALGIPAAYAVLALLCNVLRIPMLAAAPIATLVLLVYNYLSARLAIMRRLVR
jgi:putative flippase GtrA